MSSIEEGYVRVAEAREIAVGAMKCVSLGGREILVCHTAEGFFAVDAICSHAYARLDEGRLRGNRVLCPRHGASFDVRDGRALSRPATAGIRSYPVRVDGDSIELELPPGDEP